MGTASRFAAGCVAVGLLAAAAAGSGQHPPAPAVPPTQEIEVLDPGVDPTGRPTAVLRPGPNGTQQIDIPPTVLVLRYYYTGDRSFQGPLLTGGPVVVAASHPRTLERVYVPLVLPPGAPRVFYTRDAIRFDYGPQSIALTWGLCGNPQVRYGQATWVGDRTRGMAAEAAGGARDWVRRTGLPQGVQRFKEASKDALTATADRINDAGRIVSTPVVNLARALPGAQLLTPSPEDSATRARQAAERAGVRTDPDRVFVPSGP